MNKDLNKKYWERNRDNCIRLAVERLEVMMKRHLLFLSDQVGATLYAWRWSGWKSSHLLFLSNQVGATHSGTAYAYHI